ncbi:MAG: 6,7-dimethyl-8-ribityllumazine synthase [Gammaproteobacteria bacterium]|nr:MAG: 6,7-dimethyl-8-ribityllumazine synthase [Gammaproteobacteria bacterium]
MKGVENVPKAGSAKGLKIGIVASRYNSFAVDRMVAAAVEYIERCGGRVESIKSAPGAFELPLAVQKMIEMEKPDAVMAFGVVIKGETPHFDYVSSSCIQGLASVSLKTGIPVGMGVLTVLDVDQAKARSGENRENKGYETAAATIEMANLYRT